jgi:ABC-type Co2+ transport system permease subunit
MDGTCRWIPPGPSVEHVTSTTLISILIGVAVAALLVVRQLRAQPLNANMRLPLILGVIGLIELVDYLGKHHPGSTAIGALVGSLALAAVFGALRAATVHLWVQDGQPWRKGNWLTGVLWVLSLAAHFGIDYLIDPHNPNGGLAGSTILIYLAVTYTVQRLIMQARAQRLPVDGGQASSLTSGRI